jgi:hypothetical protein
MKTFSEFLKEGTSAAMNAITSNPSKKYSEMVPLLVDAFFESWFNANGVKVISSDIYKTAGNRYYFASKGDQYYIFMLNQDESFATIKFSSLSDDDIKTLTKSPDIYLNPIKNKSKVIKDILTL